MATEDIKNKSSQEQQMPDKGRRDALKTLATVPVLGALAYGVYKTRKNALQSRNISDVCNQETYRMSSRSATSRPYSWSPKKMVSRSVWVSLVSVSVANN